MDDRQKLLEQIMAYDFCLVDLGLFWIRIRQMPMH